jgi:3-deoxy-D-manno-octulosonic-acid transferase
MTPTGRATGEELFGDRVERAWLPYDMGFAVRGFLRHYRPRMGIVLETEIWPRLFDEAARARIPVVLANGRLSERSARLYARAPALTRWAFASLAGVAAQTESDARRFREIGAADPVVTGNVKFDLAVPDAMRELGRRFRERFGAGRTIWVAGSTRDGEEALLLEAFARLAPPPDVLLVIVPRHPQRFNEVARIAESRSFAFTRRSAESQVTPATRVVVGDSMGEMLAYYEAADVVIMGGSLPALRRTEPHRAVRAGTAGRGGAAHLQLLGGGRRRDRRGRRSACGRCQGSAACGLGDQSRAARRDGRTRQRIRRRASRRGEAPGGLDRGDRREAALIRRARACG